MQNCSNSSVLAMEILQSCTKPSILLLLISKLIYLLQQCIIYHCTFDTQITVLFNIAMHQANFTHFTAIVLDMWSAIIFDEKVITGWETLACYFAIQVLAIWSAQSFSRAFQIVIETTLRFHKPGPTRRCTVRCTPQDDFHWHLSVDGGVRESEGSLQCDVALFCGHASTINSITKHTLRWWILRICAVNDRIWPYITFCHHASSWKYGAMHVWKEILFNAEMYYQHIWVVFSYLIFTFDQPQTIHIRDI